MLLTSCAGPVRESEQMIRQGQVNEGLAKLEEAVRNEPGNTGYQAALYRNREAVINEKLVRADTLAGKRNFDEAEAVYNDVLTMHAGNPRAAAGLNAVAAGRRQDNWVADARKQIKDGNPEEAKTTLKRVLVENPNHTRARDLMKGLEGNTHQPGVVQASMAAAYRKPVSLEFRDAPLSQVFHALSTQTQLNFIFDRDVRPDLKTTTSLRNVPLEQAINLLLVTNQLDKKVLNETTILIYPNQPAKQRDYQELVLKSFYLVNADAKNTMTMLKTLLKTRDIFVDDKLNLLIMRDTPQVIAMAEKLIEAQDKAEPEVMLDVQVLEVKRTRLTELGLAYPTSVQASLLPPGAATGLVVSDLGNINRGNIGVNRLSGLSVTANLLKTDGDTNILANPRIRVKNRDKAKIHIGDRVPVITTTLNQTVTSESVTYLDVGLKLEVEPNVYMDDDVGIKVNLEVSNIVDTIINTTSGSRTYQIGTREATTNLRLRNGETQVLAGLISDEDRKTANKIPGLGDLPILGHLFSSHRDDNAKTEIILLITPHIVRNLERPDAEIIQFSSGTESSLGAAPLQVRSAPYQPDVVPVPPQFVPGQPGNGLPPSPLQGVIKGLTLPPGINLPKGLQIPPGLVPQPPEPVPAIPQGTPESQQ
jgi:general secretion pathway protein D